MARLPDRSVCPEQVRNYIIQTLTSKHKTDPNFAEEAARSWQFGRGSELHETTLKDLQEDDAWERSYIGTFCNWMLYISAAFLLCSITVYFSGYRTSLSFPLLLFGAALANYAYQRPTRKYDMLAMGICNICIALLSILWVHVR
ncbi:hypothetical protein RU639_006598 [Aspergillus parasiticus]